VGSDPARAWHAFLGPDVRPTVHFKHAIDPSYFLHCTARFVDHNNYNAVLLDLAANMFGHGAADSLQALIARVRCLSSAPSVAIINWPGVVRTNATQAVARHARATLIEVPHGPDLYSTDKVHPNALGHARIAERVRAYLARPPPNKAYTETCPTVRPEECFPNALDMPVVRDVTGVPHGWKLVDESPTPDLVHKYGWASSADGATLSLVIPKLHACGAVVTLAYLASNSTGSFLLSCAKGCACSPIRTFHQKRIHPFPVVTGREDCGGSDGVDCKRITITRDTAFNLLREREEACRVDVTVLTNRRVRLDGLYVQEPSDEFVRYARYSPPSTAEQRWFGWRALNTTCM
jgi:hypothetical protein